MGEEAVWDPLKEYSKDPYNVNGEEKVIVKLRRH